MQNVKSGKFYYICYSIDNGNNWIVSKYKFDDYILAVLKYCELVSNFPDLDFALN